MERLTQKSDKMIWFKDQGLKIEPCEMNAHHYRMILEKLADYEDAEEQGLLVRLPDGLNRTLYQINYSWTECTEYGEEYNKCEIYDCKYDCDSRKEYYIAEVDFQYIPIGSYYNRLNKTLFLAREEAEKKLDEMKNND